MSKLRIDTSAIVAPESDCLYVHSRKGDFELKGKQIGLLYQKLTPALDGRFSKKEILSAVPQTHHKLFADCLQRLEDSGVVALIPQPASFTGIPAQLFSEQQLHFDLETETRKIRVHLGVPQPTPKPPGNCAIFICEKSDVGRLLISRFYRRFKQIVLYLLVVSSDDISRLRETGRLSAGLLNNLRQIVNRLQNLPFSGGQVVVFRPKNGFLKSEVHFSVRDMVNGNMQERLNLIRPLSIDQIPLIGVAAKSLFWKFEFRHFGFSYPEVQKTLLRRYQAKALIESSNLPTLKTYEVRREVHFARLDAGENQVNPSCSKVYCDSNRDTLFLGCLANLAVKKLESDWHEIIPHKHIPGSGRLVQHALKLLSIRNADTRPCYYTITPTGLHVYKYNDRMFFSFCNEKAFAEMLICLLADVYSGISVLPYEASLSLSNFLSKPDILRLVDHQIERLTKLSGKVYLHYASRRVWGNTVCFGNLSGMAL